MGNKSQVHCSFCQYVTVVFHDDRVWKMCVDNWDDKGVPQPREKGGDGFRDMFYDFKSMEEVASHLAYNYLHNGMTVNELDGFILFPKSAVSYINEEMDADFNQ